LILSSLRMPTSANFKKAERSTVHGQRFAVRCQRAPTHNKKRKKCFLWRVSETVQHKRVRKAQVIVTVLLDSDSTPQDRATLAVRSDLGRRSGANSLLGRADNKAEKSRLLLISGITKTAEVVVVTSRCLRICICHTFHLPCCARRRILGLQIQKYP